MQITLIFVDIISNCAFPFAIIISLFLCGLYVIHIIAISYAKYRLHRPITMRNDTDGVSIIKPLIGTDENLFFNLESFFKLKYHCYELLFCVHDASDPSQKIVEALMMKYPYIDARLFCGSNVGLNPKIDNMMPAYRASKYPLVLISDSRIYMREDALMDMVNAMEEDVALVTQVPFCADGSSFGANLEKVYFGTGHARIYLAANCLRFVCSTGMSSLIRKCALEDAGGMENFSDYLAEDYFFGVAFVKMHVFSRILILKPHHESFDSNTDLAINNIKNLQFLRGWKIAISGLPAIQNAAKLDPNTFQERICRWIKLRIAMLPHTAILEPLHDCFLSGILGCYAISILLSSSPIHVFYYFIFHLIYWISCDYILIHLVQNGPLSFSFAQFLFIWLHREILSFPIWCRALLNPNIKWRKGNFRLRWGGRIAPPNIYPKK
ncbi:hypothetical protein X798_01755 [Onchocerca flexuosa]|uniref:ceramide glucosyltransferase n=1 Tax=Onchocerca flexuosa TaxID=387005 RepID=A0A238C1J3_9BILA|nr:hypothetical protein X798_01755 [Onchocerca flexuosa]